MSLFDPQTFLDSSAGDALSTERLLIPIGTYANCYITDVVPKEGTIRNGDRTGEPWARIDFTWTIDDLELRNQMDKAEVKVRHGVMLDLDSDGNLATGPGKNIRLGKLRKALGINDGPVLWRAFLGVPATIQIGHGTLPDGTPTEEVLAVAGR